MARREEALGIYKEAQAQEEWILEQRETHRGQEAIACPLGLHH
jgi:hypothetical protein